MRLFEEYGTPSTAGDITYIDYLFLVRVCSLSRVASRLMEGMSIYDASVCLGPPGQRSPRREPC